MRRAVIVLSCWILNATVAACSDGSSPGGTATGGVAGGPSGGSVGFTGGAAGTSSGGATDSGGSSSGGTFANGGSATGGFATGGGASGGVSGGGTSPAGGSPGSAGGLEATGGGGGTTLGSGGLGTGGSAPSGGVGGLTAGTGGTGTGGTEASAGTGGSAPGGQGGTLDPSTLPAITIHLAGDSTMSDYPESTTQEGWGQEFGQFFISQVSIDNQAKGGANIQTFYDGKWQTLIANVQAGDYVLAAFGINDSGTAHGPVYVPDFTARLNTMADEVAAKDAIFIPTTSSPLQVWAGGVATNERLQPYVDATIAVAQARGLLVDDLNARGIEHYNSIGQAEAQGLTYEGDKAHFNQAGATTMARLAAEELRRIDSPLAAYLK